MKHQTDTQLTHYINKYGCFFMCMCYWFKFQIEGKEPDYGFLNALLANAINLGIISGDLNHDGDMDDSNELLVLDKNRLLELAGLKIKYLGLFSPDKTIPTGNFAIGEFYNERTKFTHFVAIGPDKKAVYDPILNSVTYREGGLKSIRLFA
jgi:hypothetical protein